MQSIAVLFLLVLPWLNFHTGGPEPHLWTWLITATCATVWYLIRRKVLTHRIASAWLLAAVASASLGVLQYFDASAFFHPWINEAQPGEAFGNLRQRNQFATLTSIGLLALVGRLGQQPPRERIPGWAYLAALTLALGNAASSSRTGLLQWGLIVLMTAWWVMPHRRQLMVFVMQGAFAYAIAVVAMPWMLTFFWEFKSTGLSARLMEPSTCASRLVLWSNVGTLIAAKPWFGWGWGELDYAHFITPYSGGRFCDILDNAHNLPLHLAVELGVPLALTLVAGLGWIVWRARPWREQDPMRQMAWGVLAVIMLHSMLEYPLWYGPFQMAVGLCVVLLWPMRDVTVPAPRRSLASPAVGMALASSILASLAYAAWDYHRISQIYLPPQARDAAYRDDTLNKIRDSWLFRDQARFAELTTTPLHRDNAQWTFDTATALLHYSPEPRVIEKVIESAVMLGRDDDAMFYLARYRAAFPQAHEKWRNALNDDGRAL